MMYQIPSSCFNHYRLKAYLDTWLLKQKNYNKNKNNCITANFHRIEFQEQKYPLVINITEFNLPGL